MMGAADEELETFCVIRKKSEAGGETSSEAHDADSS